jgi:hypothetical protein
MSQTFSVQQAAEVNLTERERPSARRLKTHLGLPFRYG